MVVTALMIAVAACGDSSSTTTTTALPTSIAETAGTTTTIGAPADPGGGTTTTATPATTTTSVVFSVPEFVVIDRSDDDVLVVAVPPATYTDIDLRNLVDEVVERFAPVNGLHVIDDESLAELVLAPTVTADEQALLDDHYFLRLEEGFRIVYLGPFAEIGEVILGS